MHGNVVVTATSLVPCPSSCAYNAAVCMALLFLAAAAAAVAAAQRPAPVPPKVGAVVSGNYRNMFVEAGYKQADIDAKINATFTQLFYGDPTYQSIYWEVPAEDTAYVSDVKNHDVRTEGMGYAMMVFVQMGYQAQFDRIWAWVQKHMYHGDPSDPLYGWSAWHCRTDGSVIDQGPAPDGETFMVTALYFAAARWGDGSGRYNYTAAANTVLSAVMSKENPPCGPQGCPPQHVVNMFDPQTKVVRFGPSYNIFTDSSYITPHFYQVWSVQSNTSVSAWDWNATARAGRDMLHASTNPSTGLAPDRSAMSAAPISDFEYDAWRVARNWAVDYSWFAADDRQIVASNTILTFMSNNPNITAYGDKFKVTGSTTDTAHAPGLVGMNAVACLASNSSLAWDFIDQLWNTPIPSGDNIESDRYYSGFLYLEALLHLSGRYRAWL